MSSKEEITLAATKDEKMLLQLNKAKAALKSEINKLYDLVSKNIIEMDETLSENLQGKKVALSNTQESINSIKAKLPLKKFGEKQINRFVKATLRIFSQQDTEKRNNYY